MRISDWSSYVCSSDLTGSAQIDRAHMLAGRQHGDHRLGSLQHAARLAGDLQPGLVRRRAGGRHDVEADHLMAGLGQVAGHREAHVAEADKSDRSEEHTSELQSLMRISYAVFCLKKKKTQKNTNKYNTLLHIN